MPLDWQTLRDWALSVLKYGEVCGNWSSWLNVQPLSIPGSLKWPGPGAKPTLARPVWSWTSWAAEQGDSEVGTEEMSSLRGEVKFKP